MAPSRRSKLNVKPRSVSTVRIAQGPSPKSFAVAFEPLEKLGCDYLALGGTVPLKNSTFAGFPCVFVRPTACSARCVWCDTPHAFNEGDSFSIDEALEKVLSFGCVLVELTGGGPLLQEEALALMTRRANSELTVLLETSGTVPIEGVDPRAYIIMDLKCPDSGECDNNLWANLDLLKPSDQIKFVIASKRDFDWTDEIIRCRNLDRRLTVLLSAVFDSVTPHYLADWLLESGLQVQLQLQLHKYIWNPQGTGV